MTPEQLTAVSRPLTNENVLDPSDSDEDVGEFQVHEGGGARLGRSRTSTPKKSPGRAKRGAKDEGTGSVDSGPTSRASSRRSRRSGIGAEEIGTGAGIGNSGATGIRRSKTTPSRKGAGASAGAGATAGSSRIVSVEGGGTRPKSRRKSSGASTPASGSAQASPSPGSPAQLAPLTPVALASVAGAGRRETGSGPPSMATMDLQTQARSSVELGGSSREQKTPSSAAGAGTGAGEGAGAGAAVENVQGYPTPPSSKLLSRSDIGASASASGGGGGGGSGAASIAGEGRGSIEEVTRQYGGAPSTG